LRPSSGALQIVTAATGVCQELGWNKSCIDVQGRLRTVLFHGQIGLMAQSDHGIVVFNHLDIYTGFIPFQLLTNTSGCCYTL